MYIISFSPVKTPWDNHYCGKWRSTLRFPEADAMAWGRAEIWSQICLSFPASTLRAPFPFELQSKAFISRKYSFPSSTLSPTPASGSSRLPQLSFLLVQVRFGVLFVALGVQSSLASAPTPQGEGEVNESGCHFTPGTKSWGFWIGLGSHATLGSCISGAPQKGGEEHGKLPDPQRSWGWGQRWNKKFLFPSKLVPLEGWCYCLLQGSPIF